MKPASLLLLYGIDEQTLPIDASATLDLIQRAGDALRSCGWHVVARAWGDSLDAALAPFPPDEWLVFNLCEGSPSQPFYYARAAKELERRGYAYTGSDAVSLDQTQFKPAMKHLLEAARLPTPRWTAVKAIAEVTEIPFTLFPAIVKPAGEHCSFGITRESVVFTLAEARAQAAAVIRQYPDGAIIEEFLDSEEYAVSLWGDDNELASLGISVIHYDAFPELRDRLCTFEAKWLSETDAYQKTMPACPALISQEFQAELETLARRAHIACGVRDYSRVDIRLRDGRPEVLDVNANCAIAENGGFADTARIAGLEYGVVLDRLAMMAARRLNLPAVSHA